MTTNDNKITVWLSKLQPIWRD